MENLENASTEINNKTINIRLPVYCSIPPANCYFQLPVSFFLFLLPFQLCHFKLMPRLQLADVFAFFFVEEGVFGRAVL